MRLRSDHLGDHERLSHSLDSMVRRDGAEEKGKPNIATYSDGHRKTRYIWREV